MTKLIARTIFICAVFFYSPLTFAQSYFFEKSVTITSADGAGIPETSFDLPTFNTALGTLTGVQFISDARFSNGSVSTYCLYDTGCWANGVVGFAMGLTLSGQHLGGLNGFIYINGESLPPPLFGDVVLPLSDINYAFAFNSNSSTNLSDFEGVNPDSTIIYRVGGGFGGSNVGSGFANPEIFNIDLTHRVYLTYYYTPSPVPEPEIYALMGLGLGLLGWIGRRKAIK